MTARTLAPAYANPIGERPVTEDIELSTETIEGMISPHEKLRSYNTD